VDVGAAAGQTVDHAHLHVTPRYPGDVDDPRGGIRWIMPARARSW
jgi:diadenosine tetraphosphate (Ap4A) HIT family hydrolase